VNAISISGIGADPVGLSGSPPHVVPRRVRPMAEVDDGDLMVRYAGGDLRAFEALYRRHRSPLYRYLARHTRDPEVANDIFQEVWSRVISSRARYEPRAKFSTFLYRIAHNVALTRRTRNRHRQSRESPLDQETAAATDMDFRRLALKRAIAGMAPGDRTLTVLWLEGLSAAEIEDVTGIKAATVAVRLSRIRKRLHPIEVSR